MKASMNSSATAIYEGKLNNSSYVFDVEGTNAAHPIAPCGSCSDEMIMNENLLPYWYQGESTSITTNERDNLPLRALDGPGLQIGVLYVGLQMLSNPHLSLSMAKDIPTNTLKNNWSAVGR
jgi:hypothetical protein